MAKRTEHRRDLPRVTRGLTIVARGQDRDQICILADASRGGACLRLHPSYNLPKRFTIILENVEIPVVTKWRTKERAGVRFGALPADAQNTYQLLLGRPNVSY